MPHLYDSDDVDSVVTDDQDTPLPGRYHSRRMDSGRLSEPASAGDRDPDEDMEGGGEEGGWERGEDLVPDGGHHKGRRARGYDSKARTGGAESLVRELHRHVNSGSESNSAEEGGDSRPHSPEGNCHSDDSKGKRLPASSDDDHQDRSVKMDARGGRLSAGSSASSTTAAPQRGGLMGSAPLVDRVVERVFRLSRPKDKR